MERGNRVSGVDELVFEVFFAVVEAYLHTSHVFIQVLNVPIEQRDLILKLLDPVIILRDNRILVNQLTFRLEKLLFERFSDLFFLIELLVEGFSKPEILIVLPLQQFFEPFESGHLGSVDIPPLL